MDQLRGILQSVGGLSVPIDSVREDADLFAAGLSSLAVVNLMAEIEHQFGIEIPDELLTPRTFRTLASIRSTVSDLRPGTSTA